MLLPSIVLAIGSIVIYYRLLRNDLIATLQEDFITMARSKGLSRPPRPAAPRPAAVVGLAPGLGRRQHRRPASPAPSWSSTCSSCPGLGYELVAAINQDDYLIVQGIVLVVAVAVVVINFIVDFLFTRRRPEDRP